MSKRKALYDEKRDDTWFTEFFGCKVPGRTIPIKVFQPLFIALDQVRQYPLGYLNRSQLTEAFLGTFRSDLVHIRNGMEKWFYNEETGGVRDKYKSDEDDFLYHCIRSLVFEEGGNTCVVSLDMLEKVVHIPDTGTVEDNLVAVMALFMWKNSHAGLSTRVQLLQQSPLELHRKAASVFTNLLHPLVHTFREVFPESNPVLYSTRKRCTYRQINKLKQELASNNKQQVSVTSTSLMSLSTSYAFCKRYQKIEDVEYGVPRCPMMLTIQVQETELPMFVPVVKYVREDFEKEHNKEHEVLLFPGANMVFRNIQPAEIEVRTGATSADVEIVGMDVSNIHQETAISNRVVTMIMKKMAGIDLGASAYDTTRNTTKFEW